MRRKSSTPPSAPKQARKDTASERQQQYQARIQALIARARRGETPEEIIDKGRALIELKRLKPWKHDGTGTFNAWALKNLPYREGRANQYILIAQHVSLEQVAGKNLCFDALLALAESPADKHAEMIQAAENGAGAEVLRRIGSGLGAKEPPGPAEHAERLLRQQQQQAATLRRFQQEGAQVPAALLDQLAQGADEVRDLIAELRGAAAKTDPIGSAAPANPPPHAAIDRLCVDYQPAPLVVPPLNMPKPATWPTNWFAEWIEKPVKRDAIILGAIARPSQSGTLGLLQDDTQDRVAISLEGGLSAFFFSHRGAGAAHACNVIMTMSLQPHLHINDPLPRPLCAVMLHPPYDDSYDPEALSLISPSRDHRQVQYLVQEMHSMPRGLADIVLLCHHSRVEPMRRGNPYARVFPLLFGAAELGPYVEARPDLLRPLLGVFPLGRLPRAGRLIIIDARIPGVGRQDAIWVGTLAVQALLQGRAMQDHGMLVRVDDVHEFLKHPEFVAMMRNGQQERGEQRVSWLVSTQDPRTVPVDLLGGADLVGVGRAQEAGALAWLTKAKPAYAEVSAEETAELADAEMLLHSEARFVDEEAAEPAEAIIDVQVRAQSAHPGNATRAAEDEGEG